MTKKLETVVKGLLIATFFVPLLVAPSTYIFPFIFPKIIWLRSLVLITFGLYTILLYARHERFKISLSPTVIAVGAFFVSLIISTFVGVDWYHSMWDNHERMLGLFTLVHYALYFVVLSTVVRTWEEWRTLWRWFLGAGSIVMFIAVLQKINPELLLNAGSPRVSSTLGNSIYLGGYGIFMAFGGLLLAAKETVKAWKWVAYIEAVLGVGGIFMGGTRGALVGLLVGLAVFGVWNIFTSKENKRLRQLFAIGAAVVIVVAASLFVGRHTAFVKSIPALGPLLNTSASEGTGGTRIMAWKIAIKSWKEKPVFGWGPNNFFFAFNEHYSSDFLLHGWGETWFDNAHNIIMNTLAVQGGFGVVTYLSMFGVAVFAAVRSYRRGQISAHMAGIMVGFLVAHLVQNIFVFENPTSYLYFFFFLAFITSLSTPLSPQQLKASEVRVPTLLSSVVAVAVVLLIYSTNVVPAKANALSLLAIRDLYVNSTTAIEEYKAAAALGSPHIDDIRADFSRTIAQLLDQYQSAGRTEEAKKLFALAHDELIKNRALHPADIRTHLQQGQFAIQAAQLWQDGTYLSEGAAALEDAMAKSPERQQVHYLLSTLYLYSGKGADAVGVLRKSIEQQPTIQGGWWRLVATYGALNKKAEALAVITEAKEKGIDLTVGEGSSAVKSIQAMPDAPKSATIK